VPDILAIVSKAVFEKDARVAGKTVTPGSVWPIDRYVTTTKPFRALEDGGRIFLVTVRPPNEELWFVGVVDNPTFDGAAWIAKAPNALPVTDITPLRKTIRFESGKGMSQDKGTLGMSLQTPRVLTAEDAAQILAVVGGAPPKAMPASVFAKTEASPKDRPARVIGGKYEILRPLGEGGMGVVYEARHTTTGRRVAVKEIVGEAVKKDPQLLERFQREARVTGTIESQHIAMVLDAGTDPNPFLVMELLHGEDLQQLLVRLGPIPEEVALRICAQACLGLMRAHEAGIVHRDIKPANLFLARRDADEIVVKLLDFGIARVREELTTGEYRRALTSTGLMLGTPLYMSPEQVKGPKHVDHRSDVFSLGVVLFEMLTGRTPHADEETLGALLVAICATPAPPLESCIPGVRGPVAAIVKKALELDPAKRYATAEEMLHDLEEEIPSGVTLHDSMLAWRPASVRADTPADRDPTEAAIGLASTVSAPGGTLQSKEAPSALIRKG
jgi:serine/threonine protein kinase